MIRVKIIYSITGGPVMNEVVDAKYVEKDGAPGYKIFHHTGWWWVPQKYVEVVEEEKK